MSKSIQKKTYIKPELTQIDLKSEELLLTNCKLTTGGTVTSGRTDKPCAGQVRCSTITGTS